MDLSLDLGKSKTRSLILKMSKIKLGSLFRDSSIFSQISGPAVESGLTRRYTPVRFRLDSMDLMFQIEQEIDLRSIICHYYL
jgi:hypothetical protein